MIKLGFFGNIKKRIDQLQRDTDSLYRDIYPFIT